jgi:hypothetical protein
MPTTSNFGWTTPADTDLVKDGAAAIRTLGNGVDASFVDLKGGTTGQVLTKASGTDLDFSWTAVDPLVILDAKGDLISATAADTPARLASSGVNGDVLTVATGESTGLKWATPAAQIQKNYLINGGFAIAQRGTSFTASNNNDDAYTLDRWYILSDTNDVIDVTQDTTTVPTNGQFAIALDVETVNKKFGIATIIENKDCVGLIGNTVTFSFKAKVSATTKLDNVKAAIVAWSGTADTVTSDIISAWNVEGTNPTLIANATYENTPANLNLTTSYATYSVSAAVDTASTKNLILFIWSDVTDTTLGDFLYIAESKLELGSTATAFQYAGGTLQGELAACQRYFVKFGDTNQNYGVMSWGQAYASTNVMSFVPLPVTMRVKPASITFSNLRVNQWTSYISVSSMVIDTIYTTPQLLSLNATVVGANVNVPYTLGQDNNSAGKLEVSAEL